jgi:conjugal transfer pilus assembly protein TraL
MDYEIPRTHDAPMKFIFWDFDQAMIFMTCIVFGILADLMVPGIVLGLLLGSWYGRRKVGKHPMFILHSIYWHLPSELLLPFPSLPPSCTREFIG